MFFVILVLFIILIIIGLVLFFIFRKPNMEIIKNNDDVIQLKYRNPTLTNKIAAFDIDGTLMVNRGGFTNLSRGGYVTWQYTFADVPKKLRELYKNGYTIVVMSNQTVLSSAKYAYKNSTDDGCNGCDINRSKEGKVEDFIKRMTDFCHDVDIPLLLIGGKTKEMLKPCCGMLDFYKKMQKIDKFDTDSFYCGDQAGRKKGNFSIYPPGNPQYNEEGAADISYTDYLFAKKCGLPFKTPEEVFGKIVKCDEDDCKPKYDSNWKTKFCNKKKCGKSRICMQK